MANYLPLPLAKLAMPIQSIFDFEQIKMLRAIVNSTNKKFYHIFYPSSRSNCHKRH